MSKLTNEEIELIQRLDRTDGFYFNHSNFVSHHASRYGMIARLVSAGYIECVVTGKLTPAGREALARDYFPATQSEGWYDSTQSEGWYDYRRIWSAHRLKSERRFYSFLSYSRRDDEFEIIKPFVHKYADIIRNHIDYCPIFVDELFLEPTDDHLRQHLADALLKSDFTTSFISPGYASSPWCSFEWWETIRLCEASQGEARPSRHNVLPFLWKKLNGRDEGAFLRFRHVDLRDEFMRWHWRAALEKAVSETLRFLTHEYNLKIDW
jgi:hypothetical protein